MDSTVRQHVVIVKTKLVSPVTGVCSDGCIVGWKSDKCNQGIN
jgi:hypothetical protein